MAFKMKGAPMQRNFGIGSVLKQNEDNPTVQSKLTEHKDIITGKIKTAGKNIKTAVEGQKTARAEQKAKNKEKRQASRAKNKAKRAERKAANKAKREKRDARAAESARRAGHYSA